MNAVTNQTASTNNPPVYRKTIGQTTYIIRVHFDEEARETMADKIKRLLRDEVCKK